MGEISKATRMVHKAHAKLLTKYERAKERIADIPLGEERLDPRTVKKRNEGKDGVGLDTTLTRILMEIRNNQTGEDS